MYLSKNHSEFCHKNVYFEFSNLGGINSIIHSFMHQINSPDLKNHVENIISNHTSHHFKSALGELKEKGATKELFYLLFFSFLIMLRPLIITDSDFYKFTFFNGDISVKDFMKK
jgi:hypothetical protein